jgi:hypothetical protein
MEEMSAFERQIARLVQHSTTPPRSVDAMPILRIATATSATRWQTQPLFSATKLVLAGAITAVFGGLLLAGMFPTQRDDEQAPAAATDSPRPTTEELLLGMVTEEVEPGVLRVVRDAAGHDLAPLGIVEIAVGAVGAVWTRGRSGLLHLGQGVPAGAPTSHRTNPTGLTVAVDGTVWAWDRGSGTVRSWDGEAWVERSSGFAGVEAFAVGPDGSVWAAKPDEHARSERLSPSEEGLRPPGFELAQLDGDAWAAVDLDSWPDRYVGIGTVYYRPGIVATDGAVWLTADDRDPGSTALARFDGRAWEVITIPRRVSAVLQLAAGPDGSIWVFGSDGESTVRLARYADGAWTVVETPTDIRPGTHYGSEDQLRPVVASDGAVWIRRIGNTERLSQTFCDGLLRYDGTWTGYLADRCVHSVAAGPRGEAWVVAGPIDDWSGEPTNTDVYLIDPRTVDPAMETSVIPAEVAMTDS